MLKRWMGFVLAMTMVAVIFHGHAWAVTTGTADGTYDFGGLGENDSAGTGYARLGDKFKVGNRLFIEWPSLNTGSFTAMNPNSDSITQPYTAVIKAEGGATCKTFTFKDLGVSAELELQRFASFDIVFRDIDGAQIGSTISLGTSPVFPTTSLTNISELYSLGGQWSVDNVAAIEISYVITSNGIPEARWFLNLETITIANVNAPPSAPAVTGIAPSGGTEGTPVTITGADFAGTTAVTFGGLDAASYTVDSPTQITATSPAGSAGTVDVRVTTSLGTSAISAADQFRYMTLPTVTGIAPSTGPLEGGTSVTITGTDFSGATVVAFGSTSAPSYTVVSPTQITATSPAGSSGPANVTVTTPLGTSVATPADQFDYTIAPVATSISPSFGVTGGGTQVTINGFNFTGASAVNFGSINAASFTVISPNEIVAVSPAGSVGTVHISVTTPVATSAATVADVFTFNNATGTADGIYDFGNLGLNDSAGIDSAGNGFARLGDKFKVGNDKFIQYPNVNTGPMTAIFPKSSTTLPYTAVIRAEGGTTCKTFTFKDLGISAFNDLQKFDLLDIVLKDINGDQIGSTISLGSSPVYSTTGVINISTLYFRDPWSVDGVAAIEMTYSISENGASSFASDLNLENITIANVKGAPAITTLSVSSGQTIGGDTVIITGSNFSGASAVNFGSTSAAVFTFDSPTRITATSPAVSAGMTVDITVATPLGISDAGAADRFTYNMTNQSIFFGAAPALIVGGTGTITATATSGLTPTFNSATPDVCTVTGIAVTGVAVGTCSITADQPGNSIYSSAQQVTLSFTIGKGNQTIAFGTAPAVIVGGTGTVSASASPSGLTPSFDTATPAVCTISGTAVTGVTAGTCIITATQSGNAAYNSAPQVMQSFSVGKADQVISFSTAPALVVGGTGTVSAVATPSGLAPTVISATPEVCTVSGTTVIGVSAGSCTLVANQNGDSNYKAALQVMQSFSVGKTNQTISFGAAPAVIFGGTGTVSATVNSGLVPIFSSTTPAVCTISGTTVTGVAAGTCIIAADQVGSGNYNAAPQVTQSFGVGKAGQTISFGPPPTLIVGGTGTVSATVSSGLTPTFSTTTPAVCTISGETVTGVTAGTCIIAANQAGDSNYNAAPQVTQNFSKANQIISFGAVPTVNVDGTGTVSATATSGLIPSISSLTPAVCTINGTTVTGVTAGTCIVAANQLGNNTYNSAPQVSQSFSVGKADQTISFGPAPAVIFGGTATVSATTTSGLVLTFSTMTPAVCTISGTTVAGVTAGICTISANQAGDSNYNAALQVTQNISVGKASQTVSFGPAPAVIFGGTGTVSATASSGLTPVFSSMTPAVCTISGTTVTGVTVGTCTIAADQAGASNFGAATQVSQSFGVGKADQTISFGPAPTLMVGGTGTVNAATTSGLAPLFSSMTPAVCTTSGTTVTGVTAGTCTISAKQAGDSNYNAALQITQNISVGKANQTVSFGPAPAVIFGGTGTVNATASSGLAPVFSSMTPAVCTVSGTIVTGVTVGTCTIAADQPGASDFSAASQISQSFGVGKADQTISFGPAPTLIVGGTGTVSATTTSGLAPLFSSVTPAVCTIAGTKVTGITAGSCIIAADQPGNINYNAAPQVTQNFSKANQIIYFGTAPTVIVGVAGTVSATATSGLPPTYRSLTPAVCTANGAGITGVTVGTCIIAANQAGDGAYNAASQVTQSFGVGKGNQIISFGAAPAISAGGTGAVIATAASGLIPTVSSLTPAVCTVSGTSVTGVTAGTCIIAANQPGNSSFNPAPQVTQTFPVGKGNQAISFGTIPFVIVGGIGSVSAISTSGLTPVLSSSTPSVCSVSGTIVTGISAGTCTITADQDGDATYNPASRVLQNFSVGKGSQTVSFGTIPVIVVGGTGTVNATATSGLPTSFSSMTPAICTVTGSTVTGVTVGTCTIAVNQSGDSNYNPALEAVQSISVVFSTSLPQITLSTLDDGAFSSVYTINITGTVTSLNGLRRLTINDADVSVTGSGAFSTLLTLVPGANIITVAATDTNDLTSTASRTITLDATGPLITLANGQTDNSVTRSPQVTISGSVDSDATTVMISINGGTPEPAVMAGTGFSLPVTLSSGLNTIVITATDATGKSSSGKQSIVLDDAISLAVTAPTQDLKSGRREFTLTGLVSGAEPLTVIVEMDGQSFTQSVSNGSFSQPLTFAAEKNYPITVTANDGNGSSVSITRNVTYTWPDVANGGGIMSLGDVLNAFHIALGLKQPTATDLIRCDVAPLDINGKPKGNNRIDYGDVILMLRSLVELVTLQ